MKRRFWFLAAALVLSSCANNAANAPSGSTAAAAPASNVRRVSSPDGFRGEIFGTPAPGSKFSRVQIGMPLRQVTDLIGEPSDTSGHITGKAFIPFYFGGDTSMTEIYYPGEGQLSFARANIGSAAIRLQRIIVNRSEQGYAH